MEKNRRKYLSVYIQPALIGISMILCGYFSYLPFAFSFLVVPVLDAIFTGTKFNFSPKEELFVKNDKYYDWILWSMVPIHYAIMIFFLFTISNPSLEAWERTGLILSFGLSCGVMGINIGHELGHRSTPHEKFMAKMMLLTSLYMHFYIEHNRGHHKRVSTDQDPASAPRGQWVYWFWIRSITLGWISAWNLEKERLNKINTSTISLKNEMLIFQIVQIIWVYVVYRLFGIEVMMAFLASAFIGILLLETVNYIEHYGLRRKKKDNRYHRTLPVHSWNSNHHTSRLLLFDLTRHSDHHYQASRKYQILRHFDQSPQMPLGYPGMIIMSLFPPLWFYVMDKRIKQYKSSFASGVDLA